MAEFQVYRSKAASAEAYPYLLDVQSELLAGLDTRLVIPLAEESQFGKHPIRNLNPLVRIGGHSYVALTQQMAAIHKAVLGEPEHAEVVRNEILSAIDFLITGI